MAELRRVAEGLLARREHSEWELSRKLAAKGFEKDAIQEVITALNSADLLSNSRFIESYLRSRQQKGYGPLRIQVELASRGITEDMIEHHLNIADNAWFALVLKAWQKRYKGKLPRDPKTRASQMRFLQYRGFTPEQINTIFRSDTNDA